jgi:membrane associated rhomboid family serine protease
VKIEPKLYRGIVVAVLITAMCWIIFGLHSLTGLEIRKLGILPRSFYHLTGIFTTIFVHADLSHLLGNSPALFVLSISIFYFYPKMAWRVYIYLIGIGGLGVWLFARYSYHIGASGLIFGLISFMLISGIVTKERRLMAISLLIAFVHGGYWVGLIPSDPGVSYESHLSGAIAGIFATIWWNSELKTYRKNPTQGFEEEDEDKDDIFPIDGYFSTPKEEE